MHIKVPENTVAIFNNGRSVIFVDDNYYCLANLSLDKQSFGISGYLFDEAIAAIKKLPSVPEFAPLLGIVSYEIEDIETTLDKLKHPEKDIPRTCPET